MGKFKSSKILKLRREKAEIQNKKRQRRGILIAKNQKTSNQLQRSGILIAGDKIQNGRLEEVLKF